MPILRIERGGQGMTFTLRYRLAHVIEVAARHFGHLDLLASIFHEGRPRCPLTWADAGRWLAPLGEAADGAVVRGAVASPQAKVGIIKVMSVSSGS